MIPIEDLTDVTLAIADTDEDDDSTPLKHKGSSINYVITFGGLGRPPPPYVIL